MHAGATYPGSQHRRADLEQRIWKFALDRVICGHPGKEGIKMLWENKPVF